MEMTPFVFLPENKTLLFRGRIPVANIEMENIMDGTGTVILSFATKYVHLGRLLASLHLAGHFVKQVP